MFQRLLVIFSIALFGLALVGCGGDGSDASAEPDPQEQEAQDEEGQGDDETTTNESSAAVVPTGPAPAPGTGTITLEDGREFALTISACDFAQDGTSFDARGSGLEFHNNYVGGEWFQTMTTLRLPSGNEITARASPYTEGASEATRDGSHVSWAGPMNEVEVVQEDRSTIYTGQGSVSFTCP